MKLTDEERSQLIAIHYGRHVLLIDGNAEFLEFFNRLAGFDQRYFKRTLLAFCLVKIETVDYRKVMDSMHNIEGIMDIYPIYGNYDFLLVLPIDDLKHLGEIVLKLHRIKGVKSSSICLSADPLQTGRT